MNNTQKEKILITGGTGLVGKKITEILTAEGYQVAFLSRQKRAIPHVEVFLWDTNNNYIDPEAFQNCTAIIHLAGENVAEKAWTASRKKAILESRTQSTALLYNAIKANQPETLKTFISASAIGIYGLDTGENWLQENSPAANDFLANVVVEWEKEVDTLSTLNLRTAKLRIGVVLSDEGGALEKIAQPIRYGAGAALGTGKQYLSWIHIQDLANMFIFALKNETIQGTYNAVAPEPATNQQFTKAVAKILKKPLILPNVPAFALKLGLGEMANIVLGGNRVSSQKIQEAGFHFQYPQLENSLRSLL
ncbi:MAG: TIGR01777 family protein [Cytophagales bacterium]|nr:MAG: TIGR01777 family protein [Cytophagales bacterium]